MAAAMLAVDEAAAAALDVVMSRCMPAEFDSISVTVVERRSRIE